MAISLPLHHVHVTDMAPTPDLGPVAHPHSPSHDPQQDDVRPNPQQHDVKARSKPKAPGMGGYHGAEYKAKETRYNQLGNKPKKEIAAPRPAPGPLLPRRRRGPLREVGRKKLTMCYSMIVGPEVRPQEYPYSEYQPTTTRRLTYRQTLFRPVVQNPPHNPYRHRHYRLTRHNHGYGFVYTLDEDVASPAEVQDRPAPRTDSRLKDKVRAGPVGGVPVLPPVLGVPQSKTPQRRKKPAAPRAKPGQPLVTPCMPQKYGRHGMYLVDDYSLTPGHQLKYREYGPSRPWQSRDYNHSLQYLGPHRPIGHRIVKVEECGQRRPVRGPRAPKPQHSHSRVKKAQQKEPAPEEWSAVPPPPEVAQAPTSPRLPLVAAAAETAQEVITEEPDEPEAALAPPQPPVTPPRNTSPPVPSQLAAPAPSQPSVTRNISPPVTAAAGAVAAAVGGAAMASALTKPTPAPRKSAPPPAPQPEVNAGTRGSEAAAAVVAGAAVSTAAASNNNSSSSHNKKADAGHKKEAKPSLDNDISTAVMTSAAAGAATAAVAAPAPAKPDPAPAKPALRPTVAVPPKAPAAAVVAKAAPPHVHRAPPPPPSPPAALALAELSGALGSIKRSLMIFG